MNITMHIPSLKNTEELKIAPVTSIPKHLKIPEHISLNNTRPMNRRTKKRNLNKDIILTAKQIAGERRIIIAIFDLHEIKR